MSLWMVFAGRECIKTYFQWLNPDFCSAFHMLRMPQVNAEILKTTFSEVAAIEAHILERAVIEGLTIYLSICTSLQ